MSQAPDAVSITTRIAYGFGSVAIAAKDNGFNYFLLMFYSQVMGLAPSVASLALFLALCVDAVSDPLVGYWSDNLHCRWGRRHPLMYASVLPTVIAYYLLWHPPMNMSESQMFWYLVVLSVLVRTAFTFFQIPSDAMVAELTSDYDGRTKLMSYRYFFGWACGITLATLVYRVYLANTPAFPDGILNPNGWALYGTTGAAFMCVGMLVSSIGTHQHIRHLRSPPPRAAFNLARTGRYLRETLRNRSFLALFVSAMLFAIASGVSMTLNIYFSRYYWALTQDQLWVFSPVNLGAATAALFLAPRLSARYNKQVVAFRLWIFAALFLPVPVILRLLNLFPPPGSEWLLNLLLVHSFIEIAVIIIANVMIGSMMADLAEDSERVTGRRSEGLFFSALSFSSKAITGIGIVIAGIILEVVHFPVGAAFGEVAQRTMTEFGILAVSTMVVFYLLATYAMSFYGITRASHLQTLAAIESATKMPAPRVSMD